MTILLDFFNWLFKLLKACIARIATLGGAVVSAIVAVIGFISSLFGRWSFTPTIVGWITSAERSLGQVLGELDGEIGSVLFGFLALDQLAVIAASLVALTFGVVILVFVTMLAALFVAVPAILGVRAVMKAIKTLSGGFVDP